MCVLGPSGRMGAMVLELCADRDDIAVVAAVDRAECDIIGSEVARGVVATTDIGAALDAADVYIDFTSPASTLGAARAATERCTAAVVGTTGLDEVATAALDALAQVAAVVVAPNFSLGVNVLLGLAEQASRALGREFDIEIVEIHHKRKRDAPSGTAIALAQALARGREQNLDDVKRFARDGDVGPRPEGEIGVVAVRGGDVIGEHTAYLISETERIEITHRAASRSVFAAGAIRAALWAARQPPGMYGMKHVLGL